MRIYFHEYRFKRDVAHGIAETKMRQWYLDNPQPPYKMGEDSEFLQWQARLELAWDAFFDEHLERLLAEQPYVRP